MKKHVIDFNAFLSKGHVAVEIKDEMLHMTTTKRLSIKFDKKDKSVDSYVYLADSYKLPLRIDLTVKMDSPGFYLFLGNGHLNFGTPWSDNRRIDDIAEPNFKTRFFHNHIPMNEFVDISVIYDFKAMQILINGEERFYSEKEKYMRSKVLKELDDKGFELKIACTKRMELIIKSLTITEYDEAIEIAHSDSKMLEPFLGNITLEPDQKPNFETCIALLPKEIQDEITKTDDFLRTLKPMKFKRQIEKHGNKITYGAPEYGFSYALHPSRDVMDHSLSWYIVTSSKPELWHRKVDMMEATLNKIAEASPELAERMFFNLSECIACTQCIVKTPYVFNGKKKVTCHGKMELKMCVSDFEDVRAFIKAINELSMEA